MPTSIRAIQQQQGAIFSDDYEAANIMYEGDLDKDGYMNMTEARSWITLNYDIEEGEITIGLKLLDRNNDELISYDEIDAKETT